MYKCRCCEAQTNTGRELQSCTKPFSIVFIPALASTDYCPATPKISYSAASQPRPSGLLETHNVYVAEELLNLAESIGTQPFFSQYQAGFTLGVRDPPYSVCSCNAAQDCDSITPLVNSDPVSETPHYSVNQLCALATALCQYGGDCSQLDTLGTSCSDLGASVAVGLGATSLSCNNSSQLSYTVDGLSADILEVSPTVVSCLLNTKSPHTRRLMLCSTRPVEGSAADRRSALSATARGPSLPSSQTRILRYPLQCGTATRSVLQLTEWQELL